MDAGSSPPVVVHGNVVRRRPKGSALLGLMRTTDPKQIAILYLTTSFAFFMTGGLMVMLTSGGRR
jgi:cytochrome c oxidase subunit I